MFVLAEAAALTVQAVPAVRAHPLPAVFTVEARLAQTGAIDVVAARPVSAVTHTFTVLPVRARSTLLFTPEGRETHRCETAGAMGEDAQVCLSDSKAKPSVFLQLCRINMLRLLLFADVTAKTCSVFLSLTNPNSSQRT